MAQNWEIDPETGDYVLDGGKPKQSNSLLTPAYIRLKAHRTQWLYAPDSKWGSDFYSVRQKRSARQPADIELIAERAVLPLVESGRSSGITIEATEISRHGIALEMQITQQSGKVETVVLTPIV